MKKNILYGVLGGITIYVLSVVNFFVFIKKGDISQKSNEWIIFMIAIAFILAFAIAYKPRPMKYTVLRTLVMLVLSFLMSVISIAIIGPTIEQSNQGYFFGLETAIFYWVVFFFAFIINFTLFIINIIRKRIENKGLTNRRL